MLRHVLPNVMSPVLVIATIHLAIAIITEATLSSSAWACRRRAVAGHADPHRQRVPVLRRVVDHHLPRHALVLLVLAVNLLGDWLRDALNPKLR
jgi:peptide/nickel transport system permease protein